MKDTGALPPYKEPLSYTGIISVLTIILGILFIYKQIFATFQVSLIIIGVSLGFLTYFMWDTRCLNAIGHFQKKKMNLRKKT